MATKKAAALSTDTVATIDDTPEVLEGDVLTADTADAGPALAANHHGFSGVKVRVVINAGEGDAGKDAVFVRLNDYEANVPRDQEVLLPKEVFESCIKAAKYTQLKRTERGLESKDVNRFSYSMLGEVAAA